MNSHDIDAIRTSIKKRMARFNALIDDVRAKSKEWKALLKELERDAIRDYRIVERALDNMDSDHPNIDEVEELMWNVEHAEPSYGSFREHVGPSEELHKAEYEPR